MICSCRVHLDLAIFYVKTLDYGEGYKVEQNIIVFIIKIV